ncbi:glycoside hydrolase family 1 protein [Burkholderia ambifaria]|uniref:glycoside hydrolase family 1 protein n=1 Tax=Burkholderia ambifaria TaxID=152480 RepID=UPI001E362B69|nr:glycoside hydrolase family 1 protein [Burkholderia ambifaria]UEP25815.1 glycoside hydrolase family 1 protein [Burkholderia ambifaria]
MHNHTLKLESPKCRVLLRAAAGAGSLACVTARAQSKDTSFPDGFVWGVAASAAQTESREGRGRSNWDVFSERSGAISDGSTNAKCIEFERRYPADVALLSTAGINAFRFSIAWPRIQPNGPGTPSAAGLATYDRLVDTLLANGMEPFPTLFHWDTPIWVGDFRSREIAGRLSDYADLVARRLGDRVRHWIVMNEPNSLAVRGYGMGIHAPGLRSPEAMFAAIHHQNLAQGLAFKAIRASVRSDALIGTTINLQPVRAEGDLVENQAAAQKADLLWNRAFMDPLYSRGYPTALLPALSRLIHSTDMEIIAAKPDFQGMNYYSRIYVKANPAGLLGIDQGKPPPGVPLTSYFPVEPDGLTEMLLRIHRDYDAPDIYITETGFALDDPAPREGFVDDELRSDYIARYLRAAHDAYRQGVGLKGLFYWAATDNWEWGQGFSKKFGLVHVDMETQARTPKRSFVYFARCIARNAVV